MSVGRWQQEIHGLLGATPRLVDTELTQPVAFPVEVVELLEQRLSGQVHDAAGQHATNLALAVRVDGCVRTLPAHGGGPVRSRRTDLATATPSVRGLFAAVRFASPTRPAAPNPCPSSASRTAAAR